MICNKLGTKKRKPKPATANPTKEQHQSLDVNPFLGAPQV
jgi:hypothetical protein